MIDKNTSDFKVKCGFRIEQGKDGVGTISFLHLNSYKYLYRNSDNNLIFKDINSNNSNSNSNKTEDRQRASFNIYDGLSNGIMFKSLPIEGETTNKYIIIDNNYLKIDKLNNTNTNTNNNSNANTNKSKELSTFYIIDTIIESKIITDKNDNNSLNSDNNVNNVNNGNRLVPTQNKQKITEDFTNKIVLDKTSNIDVYNKLFNAEENNNANGTQNLPDYIQDTYLNKLNNNKFISISKKFNEGSLNKILSTSLSKNQDAFNYINDLNKEI